VRGVVVTLGVVAGAWLAVVALAWGFQRQLIYLPDAAPPGPPPAGVDEVTLTTSDGLRLEAWYVPAAGDPTSVVLLTPGNAGNRAGRLPLARGMAERGHGVLLVDYRGYGGNAGRPGETGLVRDAVAAWEHLASRADVDPRRIVLLGESIGAGVAAGLAAELAPDDEPLAVVLRSPFPALAEVARVHYRFLPVGMLLRDRFPVTEQLRGVGAPVLVVAGGADTIVPTELSERVATDADASYLEIPGADHNDAELFDGARFLDGVDAFVHDAIAAQGG
jgi:uncharacterized protein